MQLPYALAITALIGGLGWLVAAIQPSGPAHALVAYVQERSDQSQDAVAGIASATQTTLPLMQRLSKPQDSGVKAINLSEKSLIGVKQQIKIADVQNLWGTFQNDATLQGRLNTMTPVAYVIYESFNDSFEEATVTIGYEASALMGSVAATERIEPGRYEQLLAPKVYADERFNSAWSGIRYSDELEAVVEVHAFNANGDITSSQLLAYYQNPKEGAVQ
ncbi:Uncharacterised protein [BD1-7 clade bacterium]|uniref:Uncharacterized protein n=1 Tax=BD1-7 clade bacterium TaxID=2029982 RepID=A0A5S9PLX9_9GAMM|nr:Uncharacterised protein [BD1-7 clade bacterium]